MKAILVDDEMHVREGLRLLADWESFGITTILEASDGAEAMQLITKYEPEIIFTDMNMPRCDGIDLLKWIASVELNSKTIVISGYDDFKYTKNAITYGSFDYLLKPINPTDLNDTLSRAMKQWHQENDQRISHKENDQVIWDHLLSSCLNQPRLSKRAIKQIEKEYQIDVSFEMFTFALLPMNGIINKKYEGNTNHAFSTLISICNDVLQTPGCQKGVAFRNINKEDELTILFWHCENEKKELQLLTRQLLETTGFQCMIAMGQSSHQFLQAYEFATTELLKQNLLQMNMGQSILSKKDHLDCLVHLFDYSERIKWAIQSGSTEQIDRMLDEVFQTFENNKYFPFEQLQLWETQFEMLKEHWLKEYEINNKSNLYKGIQYWNTQGCFSIEDFKKEKQREFHELIHLVYEAKFQKEKNTMQMIEDYIKSNYQKDLKLQDIADRFFLSREYISRKFKQEKKETITDFITTTRIKRAKELLENPYLKIYEVAEAVGYQNDKYFVKVFKKLEGLTPSEYRNSKVKQIGPINGEYSN
ncbi:response regulator [Alkalihalobacillus sp. BA299]|uniref:response regulator transcription factor n=1 Tax=Alkalihalobacillus sp. BA299 TaxID=2815938 RepID=UPI001ADAB39D|nr:response regulator [Alkalihalobacillus sp. BA299]